MQVCGQAARWPSQRNAPQDGDSPVAPAAANWQTPTDPGTLQRSHPPEQALSQQTLSAQLPVEHSLPAAHAFPFAPLETQAPALQYASEAQSESLVHAVVQVALVPSQRNGLQDGLLPELPAATSVQVPG